MVLRNHIMFSLSFGLLAGSLMGVGLSSFAFMPGVVSALLLADIDYKKRWIRGWMRVSIFVFLFALSFGLLLLLDDFVLLELLFTPFLVIGCILTDIDHTGSFIGKRLRLLSVPLSLLVGHRRFFHTLLCLAIATLLLYNIFGFEPFVVALLIGYLSHILADVLTGGVPLFWPVTNKKYSFPVLVNNIFLERVVVYALFALAVYLVVPGELPTLFAINT